MINCEKCGEPYEIGEWPFCPHGIPMGGIIKDGIPGGILIKHGLCHEDGTPRRFDSISDIKRAAFAKGLLNGDDTPKVNPQLVDQKGEATHAAKVKQKQGN